AAAGAALLAAAGLLVDGGPGTPLRFLVRDATLLVAFLDVLRLALLLAGVARLVAAWHLQLSSMMFHLHCSMRARCSGSAEPSMFNAVALPIRAHMGEASMAVTIRGKTLDQPRPPSLIGSDKVEGTAVDRSNGHRVRHSERGMIEQA